eukprot:TRINITY_DN12490_c0_g2_i1.p1 TRINITY_DN12490_c0_g2~~TRINITY_DN12490_c0_g2_i1.p1  ORF type:complete len:147 (-),score=22.05 TRINITY_DN12490_c0_g2_i1:438-842(-)
MAGSQFDDGTTYSVRYAFVYLFNLIVGVGALALPIAFERTGIILGPLFLMLVASVSFITVTFLIEAQAIANAFIVTADLATGGETAVRTNVLKHPFFPFSFFLCIAKLTPGRCCCCCLWGICAHLCRIRMLSTL